MTSMRHWLLSQIFLCSFLLTFKAIRRKEGIVLMADKEIITLNNQSKIVPSSENREYLESQILTYLGNKRTLLKYIGEELNIIQTELGKEKLITLDLFSGSGIVARYLKQFSSCVHANDLEKYSYVINSCYLSNQNEFDTEKYYQYLNKLKKEIAKNPIKGVITENYSPVDDKNIKISDRAFYTNENASFIDSMRFYIDKVVPKTYQKFFLARLIIEASIHVNTAGIFKGFYKDKDTGIGKFGGSGENALSRIKGSIDMSAPILSNYETEYHVYQKDANSLVKKLKNLDVAYLDPPYNQHPYGSNYFMLNVILNNKTPKKMSKVSGIPTDWNHSDYNKKATALRSMEDLVKNIDAKYLIISYNNEGFISQEEMENMLKKYGALKTKIIEYNAFRGSRNLNSRELKTNEYLFILHKKEAI